MSRPPAKPAARRADAARHAAAGDAPTVAAASRRPAPAPATRVTAPATGAGAAARPVERPTARPDARASRAGIGDLIAGVSLTPARPARPAGEPADGAPAAPAADPRAAARHPVGSGLAFERVEDVYRMDPARVVLDGPYVRQFVEDADFQRLCAAVAHERDIGQHIGVRVVGPPTEARRVLVYGMRRWKAALHVGLDKVPVRDYGRITEDKAVELQMLENELRADPHPVDTALGFYLLSQQPDWSQKRIADVFDKNKGYVSEMVRVGEAIARLREADRRPLYTAPRVTVRAFQNLAVVKSVEARREALLALVDSSAPAPHPDAAAGPGPADDAPAARGGDAPTRRAARPRLVDESVFSARVIRNGRAFRVRWTDDDLRRDADRIAEEFRARFLEEYQLLLHRAAVLQGQAAQSGGVPADIAALVASAAQDAARVDARIGAALPAAARHPGDRRA
jgi:ParB/RepB/Spo0J family partition protein